VTATAVEQGAEREGTWRLTAVRLRLGLVALLVALAAVAWWWTAHEMRGMDDGPWTSLGGFGWFVSIWVVMMAAMMFPSVAPTVALYSRMTRSRSALSPLLFAGGYLFTWAAAGLVAAGLAAVVAGIPGQPLAWDHAGRWVAGGTLLLAAGYELTPLKEVCLGKCRSPLGTLLGSWRDGPWGGWRMGLRNGAWCVGCCWALMASLFALGVMSVTWMAFVAALIALEKLAPWRVAANRAIAIGLLAIGVGLAATPGSVPALTVPGSGGSMVKMDGGRGGMPNSGGAMPQPARPMP
jgi:predicted metal-binding membrane protein